VEEVRLLTQANDALADVDLALMADEDLGDLLVAIEREEARLAATKAVPTAHDGYDAYDVYDTG
jgi:hypothetical protein